MENLISIESIFYPSIWLVFMGVIGLLLYTNNRRFSKSESQYKYAVGLQEEQLKTLVEIRNLLEGQKK